MTDFPKVADPEVPGWHTKEQVLGNEKSMGTFDPKFTAFK